MSVRGGASAQPHTFSIIINIRRQEAMGSRSKTIIPSLVDSRTSPERRCSLICLACAELHLELLSGFSRKEVFQPHLPVRLPCYDLAPITCFTLGRPSRSRTSGAPGFHGLTGGVYKARERIHRAMADARLLANPASWSRVADSSPNWEGIS